VGVNLNRYFEEPFSAEEDSILKRFCRVFHQAYTRFLDLKKAEAQAREANRIGIGKSACKSNVYAKI
jgi:hypothetical protein